MTRLETLYDHVIIKELKDFKDGLKALHDSLDKDFKDIRKEFRDDLRELRTRNDSWMRWVIGSVIGCFVGVCCRAILSIYLYSSIDTSAVPRQIHLLGHRCPA